MECMTGKFGRITIENTAAFSCVAYFLWYSVYTNYATLSRGIFNKQNTMVI